MPDMTLAVGLYLVINEVWSSELLFITILDISIFDILYEFAEISDLCSV